MNVKLESQEWKRGRLNKIATKAANGSQQYKEVESSSRQQRREENLAAEEKREKRRQQTRERTRRLREK